MKKINEGDLVILEYPDVGGETALATVSRIYLEDGEDLPDGLEDVECSLEVHHYGRHYTTLDQLTLVFDANGKKLAHGNP